MRCEYVNQLFSHRVVLEQCSFHRRRLVWRAESLYDLSVQSFVACINYAHDARASLCLLLVGPFSRTFSFRELPDEIRCAAWFFHLNIICGIHHDVLRPAHHPISFAIPDPTTKYCLGRAPHYIPRCNCASACPASAVDTLETSRTAAPATVAFITN